MFENSPSADTEGDEATLQLSLIYKTFSEHLPDNVLRSCVANLDQHCPRYLDIPPNTSCRAKSREEA